MTLNPARGVTDTAHALTYTQWGVTDDFLSVTAREKEITRPYQATVNERNLTMSVCKLMHIRGPRDKVFLVGLINIAIHT